MGWIRQHKICSAVALLLLIGAIVGGAVGATLGGSSSSPPPPTIAPTLSPTAAPTLAGFGQIADALSTITPYSVLTDPITPQSAAVNWLMREDEYDGYFNDTPKLLQRYALAAIYFATVGASWTRQFEFLTNKDDCLWTEVVDNITFGVKECNERGLATKLGLCKCVVCIVCHLCSFFVVSNTVFSFRVGSAKWASRHLAEEIRGLPLLVEFGAADNNMKGTIPSGITALTELVDIFLFESGVSGTLPQEMSNLSKLTHLALQNNDLTGSIPSSLYGIASLKNLLLSDNRLSGTLLTVVGNLVSLKQLWLSTNRFSGIIPSDVSRLTSLSTLRLSFLLICFISLSFPFI